MFDYQSYGAFKGSAAAGPSARWRRIARRLGLGNRYLRFLKEAPRQAPLLEIGCGDGSFLRDLMQAGFERVAGVEPSPSYTPVVDPQLIHRTYADAFLAPLAPASLGTVVALDVFEHIPVADLRALLAQIENRLQPGGLLLLRVPNLASPLGLFNYFGDLSHTTALNEMSLRQLAFDSAFAQVSFQAEPFAYPRSATALLGLALWLPYRCGASALLAAFGVKPTVLTPNLVCVMTKGAPTPQAP